MFFDASVIWLGPACVMPVVLQPFAGHLPGGAEYRIRHMMDWLEVAQQEVARHTGSMWLSSK